MKETIEINSVSLRTEHSKLVVAVRIGDTYHDIISEYWPWPETEGTIYHSVTGIGVKAILAGLRI